MSEEEERRQDLDAYCPRMDKSVLILGDTCFFPDKKAVLCRGCVFDGDFITVKVILLLAEILQERSSGKFLTVLESSSSTSRKEEVQQR
jgi:hypothetical protein